MYESYSKAFSSFAHLTGEIKAG